MKNFIRFLSYMIVFLLGCLTILGLTMYQGQRMTKLEQLELLIENRFIGESDHEKMMDGAAAGMVASLGDRWSYYVSAADYAAVVEQQDNAYVGIGITILEKEEHDGFRIIVVQERGPAKEAGIQLDDVIVSADGQSVAGWTVEELRNVIRGREGTSVRIGILRGDEELEFEVMRTQILTDVASGQMLNGGIGLVSIKNFDSRCAEETIAVIEDLRSQGAQSLILDVRNNSGGYADELVALLDYLLPEGVLFQTVDYAGEERIDYSDAAFLDMPMCVLCNENSYSAAEFFAAAIQEYGAGPVIGTPTIGKGYFQYTFQLFDGSAVGLSVGKYFTPNGVSLIGTGIQPDIQVDVDDETFYAIYYSQLQPQDDPQVLAAIEALTK